MRSDQVICLIAFFVITLSFFGCKKVIDVDLNNADTQLVITGEVNNRPGPYHVNISKSVNFSSDNIFPPVSGAFVTITGNGLIDTLAETMPGDYTTHNFTGIPGFTYQLNVEANGHVYKATSTMPQAVHIDSITFIEGINNRLYPIVNFQDPPGVANFYRFLEYANNVAFNSIGENSIFNDRLSDGRYINLVLYDDNDTSRIKPGIKLMVQMNCVDENVYNYFNGLLQVASPGSPTPANPPSNITGGALGYFSANAKTSRVVEIP